MHVSRFLETYLRLLNDYTVLSVAFVAQGKVAIDEMRRYSWFGKFMNNRGPGNRKAI